MLAASQLWTWQSCNCAARADPLVLGNDTTFFEKSAPDAYDIECKLGVAGARHRKSSSRPTARSASASTNSAGNSAKSGTCAGRAGVEPNRLRRRVPLRRAGHRRIVRRFRPGAEQALKAAAKPLRFDDSGRSAAAFRTPAQSRRLR